MATRQGDARASAATRPVEAEFLEDPMFHQRYRFSARGDGGMPPAESCGANGPRRGGGARRGAAEFAERYKETTPLLATPGLVQRLLTPPLAWLSRRRDVSWRAPR